MIPMVERVQRGGLGEGRERVQRVGREKDGGRETRRTSKQEEKQIQSNCLA